MAAIRNQETHWKESALQRAEQITDYWDIIKAYAGRSAEIVLSVCMFISIIGVLPGVHYWDWVGNFVLSVQIIMLDMGGFALNTLAEQARDNGHEEAAGKAERMATFLIRLVIATLALITIGQLASIAGPYASLVRLLAGYAETSLILVRVISTVAYIHVIHSLRGSALDIQPIPAPTPDLHTERIDQLEERLHTMEGNIEKLLESLQHVHFDAPAMDTAFIRTTIVEEIRASLPLLINPVDSKNSAIGHVATLPVSSVNTPAEEMFTVDSDVDMEQRIRTLLLEDSSLSGRALAARVGCSPTTANKWKTRIEKGMQSE